jgi:TRAP-type mannitol/chloroaromatic compound transport system permease large subunit
MGTILDSASILVVSMPLMVPVLNALNIDLIWFGILCIIAVEMGLLTPPFGMIAYGMPAVLGPECTISDVFIGSAPFLVMMLLVLTLLVLCPVLITWLPNLM